MEPQYHIDAYKQPIPAKVIYKGHCGNTEFRARNMVRELSGGMKLQKRSGAEGAFLWQITSNVAMGNVFPLKSLCCFGK